MNFILVFPFFTYSLGAILNCQGYLFLPLAFIKTADPKFLDSTENLPAKEARSDGWPTGGALQTG